MTNHSELACTQWNPTDLAHYTKTLTFATSNLFCSLHEFLFSVIPMRHLCIEKYQDYHSKVVSFLTLLHFCLPNRSCTSVSKGEQEHWHHSSSTEQSKCHTAPLWEAPFLCTENITEIWQCRSWGWGEADGQMPKDFAEGLLSIKEGCSTQIYSTSLGFMQAVFNE